MEQPQQQAGPAAPSAASLVVLPTRAAVAEFTPNKAFAAQLREPQHTTHCHLEGGALVTMHITPT
ncbi:hypothetical protein TSOC_004528 [Tetrabaena socialis]|uniref:Uncharacterized protein n=1 Tax=Tetrabaena socialis TaxID=47790 RepID=A0A2J8A8M8_9CHLO|nr:hypothetical protein TSOC_004528 [Tetrabaena socialis]|eukprot:PNH08879.1 hypothetical protein TSOC_004528 [Tetrabaena socialis]